MKKLLVVALCLLTAVRLADAADCSVNTGGAAADAQTVYDVGTTSGSGVVTSAKNPFVVGDVGKVAFTTNGGAAVNALGTITVYTNA